MKRFPVFSILSLALLIVLFSCEKETILSVDQSSVEISDAGGSQTVSLTANKPWSASSNQSWCKVSPSTGEEATNSRITITCDPNTSYDARNCTVTFTCAELTKTVSVSQATNNGLLVSQTEYNITNAAQQLEIKVQANVKFSVEVDNGCKDWVKYNTTKGLTNSTVVLDIAKNETYDNREGRVTIKQDGGNLSSTVVIKQGQTNGLFLTTSEYNLSNEKHTLTIEVKSNIEFEVKSEADWIKYVETKGLKTNQIILDVEANETYDTREGKVTVKQKNGDLTGTITIRQDQNYGILVTQSEYNLTNEAQTIDIEVKYNVEFDVIIPEECKNWITFVSTKSLDSRTYAFSIAKNETYNSREGSITFKQKDGLASGTVYIKQKQLDHLSVEKEEYLVSSEAQTLSIMVEANIDYDVEIDELSNSWLSVGETKALSQSNVLIQIAKNDGDHRTGGITLKGNEEKVRVRIEQEGINPVITYTTTDGLPIWPNSVEGSDKLEIISNSYENGVGRLVLCDTVTVLPLRAFASCNTLETMIIPDGIGAIGKYTFLNCTNLKTVLLPQSVSSICVGAFLSCESLESFSFPEGIKEISDGMFWGCFGLKDVYIPKSVTRIGHQSFQICTSLESIDIPNSVIYIGHRAFSDCCSLKCIEIPGSVKEIGPNAFSADTKPSCLEKVVLHDGIEKMADSVFENCSKLNQITIPGSIKELGSSIFEGCTSLTSATICEGVLDLGYRFFDGCTSLTEIVLPQSIKSMRATFLDCTSLREVTLPESVDVLEATFVGCSSLERVVLSKTATRLVGTFQDCTSLTEIVIPDGVKELEDTFNRCYSLSKVVLPNTISIIGPLFFNGCRQLEAIDLPEGVKEIGFQAFKDCSSLESITIPSTVSSIGDWAFDGCGNLLTIVLLPQYPPYLGRFPFSTLKDVFVPKGCLDLYLADTNWMTWVGDCLQEMPE